jgi:hypothetical protein
VKNFGKWRSQNEGYQGNETITDRRAETSREEDEPATNILMSREAEVGSMVKFIAEASAYRIEGESLVVLQFICRSFYRAIELWNLVDTYSLDGVIGTESWFQEGITTLKSSGMILQLSDGYVFPWWWGFGLC